MAKMAVFPTLKGSWHWPWPWIGSYCIPSCITHGPLPACQMSLKSIFFDGRTYASTYVSYVRTDGRTDGHLRPGFIRSTLSKSRPITGKSERYCWRRRRFLVLYDVVLTGIYVCSTYTVVNNPWTRRVCVVNCRHRRCRFLRHPVRCVHHRRHRQTQRYFSMHTVYRSRDNVT